MPVEEQNETTAEYLKKADEELRGVKLITARSLRFYKQSSGPEAVLANTLLRSTLDVYAPRFLNYNVKIELRERSTQHVVCLVSEIRQVLSNLLTNAIDAMKSAGGRLLIRTHEATDWRSEKKGILITIADTGKGMSPETRANIYRAFYTTKGESGTGLGLWISAEIVHRHHGYLRVRSRQAEPSGTAFQFFLPYQAAAGHAGKETAEDPVLELLAK